MLSIYSYPHLIAPLTVHSTKITKSFCCVTEYFYFFYISSKTSSPSIVYCRTNIDAVYLRQTFHSRSDERNFHFSHFGRCISTLAPSVDIHHSTYIATDLIRVRCNLKYCQDGITSVDSLFNRFIFMITVGYCFVFMSITKYHPTQIRSFTLHFEFISFTRNSAN